ncbi:MAG TPA: septum formation initiator family protein [Gemmatimonadales bacterium]|nr:septum formation initiator family protein [Gemmatimonadales bacterium]
MTRARMIGVVAGVVLAGVAFQGGEYSTLDWLKLRRQRVQEHEAVRELEHALDSLRRLAQGLETDPAAQERAAREQFGMIRRGELLYRLVPQLEGPSAARTPR